MKGKQHNPNPNGKAGNPITLPPMSFDETVRKMLGTEPPKSEPKAAKPIRKPAASGNSPA